MKIALARIVLLPIVVAFSIAEPALASPLVQSAKTGTAGSSVEVRGDLPKPGDLRLEDLEPLGATTATWTLHGQVHTVVGVSLDKVLRRFGWEPGVMSKSMPPAEKRAGYKRVVVATASDGFQAVFSTAEIAEGMGKTQALLVWMVDGKPLPAEQGPLRLVVLSDAEPSRSLYRLSRLDVLDMRRIVPASPSKQ